LYDAENHFPIYIIQSWPLSTDKEEWNSNGLVIGIYEETKKSCDILSNLKHNNYLPYVLAALHAKKQKWNDAIVLNIHERICDTTIANIFTIKNDVVYTPSLNEGCVAGVMRKMVIKNILNSGRVLVETDLNTGHLLTADEVFLTNSLYDIRWVNHIGTKSYGNSITRKIFTDFIQTIS
jgi:branched-chain amino acid aminotransferase